MTDDPFTNGPFEDAQEKVEQEKAKSERVHWLAGDSFVCDARKDAIIRKLLKDNDFGVKVIFDDLKPKELSMKINNSDLFGCDKNIFVYKAKALKPQMKVLSDKFFSKDNKDVLIIITESCKVNTEVYSVFYNSLEKFPKFQLKYGEEDENELEESIDLISKISKWQGSKKILTSIFRICNYSYGSTISEIEKIRIFNDDLDDDEIGLNEIKFVLSDKKEVENQEIIEAILSGKIQTSFIKLNRLIDADEKFSPMSFLGLLLFELQFLLCCRLALDHGKKRYDVVTDFVYDILPLTTSGNRLSSKAVFMRYKKVKDIVPNLETEYLLGCVTEIEHCISDIFSGKVKNNKFFLNRLLGYLFFGIKYH